MLTGSVRFDNSLLSNLVSPEYSGIIAIFGALGTVNKNTSD